MSSKKFMYFFLQSKIKYGFWWKWFSTNYLHNGNLQTVEGQNDSFSAASKDYKPYQTMNKGLI